MFILSVVFLSHAHTLLVPAFLKDHAGQTSPSINPLIIMFGHKQPNLSKLMMVRSTRSCYLQVFMVKPHFWIFLDIFGGLRARWHPTDFASCIRDFRIFHGDKCHLSGWSWYPVTGQFMTQLDPLQPWLGNPRRSRFPWSIQDDPGIHRNTMEYKKNQKKNME